MAFLDPYEGDWTLDEASHLARRCGFGARPDELDALVLMGKDMAVDSYVDYPAFDTALDDFIETFSGDREIEPNFAGVKARLFVSHIREWWVYRMIHGNHPLQEQLTLFYHDHFVSAYLKIFNAVRFAPERGNDGSQPGQKCGPEDLKEGLIPLAPGRVNRSMIATRLMLQQNNLFRETGHLGFRELLLNVTRDPAMLLYLDNARNVKAAPQENFGRELMELFSMGVDNYQESDVQAIAKVLTGETVDDSCECNWTFDYIHKPENHFEGPKDFLGGTVHAPDPPPGEAPETGMAIDLILNHISNNFQISAAHAFFPATALHMAWKYIKWFVHDTIPIDHPVVAELGTFFYEHDARNGYNYDVRETLRKLFKSQFFFDPLYRYNMYKNPAEYEVMVARNLEIEDFRYPGVPSGISRMDGMGMALFEPPNVAGWNHGRSWIHSDALIRRFNFAQYLAREGPPSSPPFMPDDYINALFDASEVPGLNDHPALVEALRKRLIQAPLRPEEETILIEFADEFASRRPFTPEKRVRKLVHIMMTLPAYQLK